MVYISDLDFHSMNLKGLQISLELRQSLPVINDARVNILLRLTFGKDGCPGLLPFVDSVALLVLVTPSL